MADYGLCDSCAKIDFLSLIYKLQDGTGGPNLKERSVWAGDNPMPFVLNSDSNADGASENSMPLTEDTVDADIASVDIGRKYRTEGWMKAIIALPRLVGP